MMRTEREAVCTRPCINSGQFDAGCQCNGIVRPGSRWVDETITHVAIMTPHGIRSLEKPNRHHNLFATYGKLEGTQGFLTNTGRFVDREEAWFIAREAGQLKIVHKSGFLFSEDVW